MTSDCPWRVWRCTEAAVKIHKIPLIAHGAASPVVKRHGRLTRWPARRKLTVHIAVTRDVLNNPHRVGFTPAR